MTVRYTPLIPASCHSGPCIYSPFDGFDVLLASGHIIYPDYTLELTPRLMAVLTQGTYDQPGKVALSPRASTTALPEAPQCPPQDG